MPEVRPAVLRRDAERLALAGGDVGAVRAGRRQDGERDGLDDRDEQRAGGVGQPPTSAIGSRRPKKFGLRQRSTPATGRSGVGEQPLQRGEVGRAGGRSVGDERDLVERRGRRSKYVRSVVAVVGVDGAADEHAVAARRAAGHQRGLGGRGGAVVVRRGDDVEAGQLGDQRLVLVDALERALADLGLVRRVGRVPLAAEQDLVDRRRERVAVGAGAEERREVDPVARRQGPQAGGELELRLGRRRGPGASARSAAGMSAKSSSTFDAEGREHPLPDRRRCAGRRPSVGQPAAISVVVGRGVEQAVRPGAASATLTRIIQPSPYGSLLTSSGLPGELVVDLGHLARRPGRTGRSRP